MSDRASVSVVMVALCLLGCPPDPCPPGKFCPLVASGTDAGPLSQCLAGAWRSFGDGGPCAPIPCRADAGPPECARADCVQREYVLFLPESGAVVQGSFIASTQGGTFSGPIPVLRGLYSVAADGKLVWDGTPETATCTAEQLVLGEFALKIRSSAAETAALRALLADAGTWTAQPLP